MSRSGYSDDNENVAMWRGMVASATRGKRGQQFFKELLAALDAMPEKRLIADQLEEGPAGEVCAIGALGRAKGVDMRAMDPEDAAPVAAAFNIAECLAQEVVYMNDEYQRYYWDPYERGKPQQRHEETPEQRWTRMREWVVKQIRAEQHSGDDRA
jgi:hypothetical protein